MVMRRNPSLEYLDPPLSSTSRRSSLSSSIFSLVSTIIGGGVLSLPYAFSQCGLVPSLVLLSLIAFASDFSISILISSSRRHSHALTYDQVAAAALGPRGRALTLLLLAALIYTALVAYLILIRDLVGPVVASLTSLQPSARQAQALYLLLVACLAPLCLMRSLHALRFTSVLSVLSVTLLAGVVAWQAVWSPDAAVARLPLAAFLWPPSWSSLLSSSPIMVNTFLCHFNVLPVHSSLVKPTRSRVLTLIHAVIALCWALYVVVGCAGYLLVGQAVDANVLNSLDGAEGGWGVVVGRLGLLVALGCNFPLLMLPCREVMVRVWEGWWGKRGVEDREEERLITQLAQSAPEDDEDEAQEERGRDSEATPIIAPLTVYTTTVEYGGVDSPIHVTYLAPPPSTVGPTAALLVTSVALSLVIRSVGTLWAVLGSSVSVVVAFTLPAVCYWVIRRRKGWTGRRLGAMALAAVSALVVVVSSVSVWGRLMEGRVEQMLEIGGIRVGDG